MHSAFSLLVFPNCMFSPLLFLFIERAMCSPEKYLLKITIIIIIIIVTCQIFFSVSGQKMAIFDFMLNYT